MKTLTQEISPDILVPGRLQLPHIQCRSDAELEDDGKVDVVELLLHHPGECFGRKNLVVKDEIHVDQVADEAHQLDD